MAKVADERSLGEAQALCRFSRGQPCVARGRLVQDPEGAGFPRARSSVVLKALMQERPAQPSFSMESQGAVLSKRTGLDRGALKEAVEELNALRLTNLGGLNVTMTGQGAEDLQSTLTPTGRRLIEYILAGEPKNERPGDLR